MHSRGLHPKRLRASLWIWSAPTSSRHLPWAHRWSRLLWCLPFPRRRPECIHSSQSYPMPCCKLLQERAVTALRAAMFQEPPQAGSTFTLGIRVCLGEEAGLLRLAIARARRAGVAKEEVSKAPCAVHTVVAHCLMLRYCWHVFMLLRGGRSCLAGGARGRV